MTLSLNLSRPRMPRRGAGSHPSCPRARTQRTSAGKAAGRARRAGRRAETLRKLAVALKSVSYPRIASLWKQGGGGGRPEGGPPGLEVQNPRFTEFRVQAKRPAKTNDAVNPFRPNI